MKKLFALLVAAFASTTLAQVAGTAHDLTAHNSNQVGSYGTPRSGTTPCQFCHTPHGANTSATFSTAPLWNRDLTNPDTGWTMYSTTAVSGRLDTRPNAASLTCLSCHEGSATLSVTYASGDLMTGTGAAAGTAQRMATATGRQLVTGRDLSNDHPVSIVYPTAATAAFAAASGNSVNGLPLYASTGGAKVECGSCHDPHSRANGKFLRVAAGALCSQCHANK